LKRVWLRAAMIVAAVAVAYSPSLRAPFIFDDFGAVVNNPTIRNLFSLAALNPPDDGSTTTGRPVVNVSFAINHAISGEAAWGYHAANIILHALAALIVMGLVERTLSVRTERESRRTSPHPLAFFTSLIWALHPLQTESVVCIAQRTEVLCGVFYLFTLYAFVRGAQSSAHGRRWWVVAVTSCLLGMGTKEVMVTAPILVLLYDRTFLAGRFATALRQRAGVHTSLACTWGLLAVLVFQTSGARGASAGFGLGVTPWTYLLKQAEAILLYLKLAVWPHPLVLDYGTAVPSTLRVVGWQAAMVVALLAATGWGLKRKPVIGFLGAALFIILAPSSSVVPLVTQTMAEHRMYLPLLAMVIAGAIGVYSLAGPGAWPFLSVVALALGVTTFARNQIYKDPLEVWNDVVAKVPNNPRAHNNLALVWVERGDPQRGDAHYARAVQLDPGYVTARYNWGVSLLARERLSEATAQFEAVIRLAPEHADGRVNLGNALVRSGRAGEAVPQFEAALRLAPAGDVHYNFGIALLALGRRADAATQFALAIARDDRLADARHQLGRIAETDGRLQEAETHYGEALRVAPNHAPSHSRLGLLLARAERLEGAAEHFRAVIRLRPNDADAHANLGNVLLLQSRPREALASYEEALRLRPGDARTQENIAIAREALR
jgi:protein O-mannosyl-transferase